MLKIFVYEGRTCFENQKWIGEVYLPTELGFVVVKNCSSGLVVNGDYCKMLQQLLNSDEWSMLIAEYPIFGEIKKSIERKK